MTVEEARGFISDYYLAECHTEEDKSHFVEAQLLLIDTYHDPNDMHNLACYYEEERNFGMKLKYLEMAAECGFHPAYEGLGYLWYYGQTGTVDYEKAYHYFCMGAESYDDFLRIGCEYKIADMFRYGYYVPKNVQLYRDMIHRLFEEMSRPEELHTILPMEFIAQPALLFRVAEIRIEEGKIAEAVGLLRDARLQLAEYLSSNPSWWGNIREMESVVQLMNENSIAWDEEIDIYDLFWIAQGEGALSFRYHGVSFKVECITEGRNIVLKFNNRWYRDVYSFFENAKIGGRPVTALYDSLQDYRIA